MYNNIPIATAFVTSEPQPNTQGQNSAGINDAGAREFLKANKWPPGLIDAFIANLTKIPIRYFICDDSGSMVTNDGHKLMNSGNKKMMVSCSRWAELTEALKFHAGAAHAASAHSEFRFLNKTFPIVIGTSSYGDNSNFNALNQVLSESPNGGTPLCRHIREVTEQIRSMEYQLRANNQRACVIVATDGESSDGDIAAAMRPLRTLPVWVVIRLCTDEEKIVTYWNNIDNELELDMDVLDDLSGEAEEVCENNKWLIYGEPLHRMREFGIPLKEIDLLDELKLSLEQIRTICFTM